jgi:hypothetical protein
MGGQVLLLWMSGSGEARILTLAPLTVMAPAPWSVFALLAGATYTKVMARRICGRPD